MYPILAEINGFALKTYYVLVLCGAAAAVILFLHNIRGFETAKKKSLIALSVIMFIPMVIGARLGYIIESMMNHTPVCSYGLIGGVSLWWGLLLSVITAVVIAPALRLDIWECADIISPSLALGGVFTRFGCMMNGCCFGIPCQNGIFPGAYYPSSSYAYEIFGNVPLQPTQLYLSMLWLLIFTIAQYLYSKKIFKGSLILLTAIIFSSGNFVIEFFRFHEIKQPLSFSQYMSIFIFCTAILILFIKIRKKA